MASHLAGHPRVGPRGASRAARRSWALTSRSSPPKPALDGLGGVRHQEAPLVHQPHPVSPLRLVHVSRG